MISGLRSGRLEHLHPIIRHALALIQTLPLSTLEKGARSLDDNMMLIIDEYATVPRHEKKAEHHEQNVDIHLALSGNEIIGVGFEHPENEIIGAYQIEKDCAFYTLIKDETDFLLTPGRFAVFFPGDIHRPGIGAGMRIRKAVIKIPVALFGCQH